MLTFDPPEPGQLGSATFLVVSEDPVNKNMKDYLITPQDEGAKEITIVEKQLIWTLEGMPNSLQGQDHSCFNSVSNEVTLMLFHRDSKPTILLYTKLEFET